MPSHVESTPLLVGRPALGGLGSPTGSLEAYGGDTSDAAPESPGDARIAAPKPLGGEYTGYGAASSSDNVDGEALGDAPGFAQARRASEASTGWVDGDAGVCADRDVMRSSLLILGEMVGAGVLALPFAVREAGWVGAIILIPMVGWLSYFSGLVLSSVVRLSSARAGPLQLNGSLALLARAPYVFAAKVAGGGLLAAVCAFCVLVTLFGAAVTDLVLMKQNLVTVAPDVLSPQAWTILVAAAALPLTWLESPRDLFSTGLAATTAAFVAVTAVIVLSFVADANPAPPLVKVETGVAAQLSAFGTCAFAFGGHALFPSLQVNVEKPGGFARSMYVSYMSLMPLYLLVAFIVFGNFWDAVQPNVLATFGGGTAQTTVRLTVTAHLLFHLIIVLNPVSQLFDYLMSIKPGFSSRRALVRTAQMMFAGWLALTVPSDDFLCVVRLVGASTVTALTFGFPSLLLLLLVSGRARSSGSDASDASDDGRRPRRRSGPQSEFKDAGSREADDRRAGDEALVRATKLPCLRRRPPAPVARGIHVGMLFVSLLVAVAATVTAVQRCST